MKRIHTFSLMLGITLGLILSGTLPYVQKALAEDKKDVITQAELDKHLDEVIQGQADLKKRIDTIVNTTQTLKAVAGK